MSNDVPAYLKEPDPIICRPVFAYAHRSTSGRGLAMAPTDHSNLHAHSPNNGDCCPKLNLRKKRRVGAYLKRPPVQRGGSCNQPVVHSQRRQGGVNVVCHIPTNTPRLLYTGAIRSQNRSFALRTAKSHSTHAYKEWLSYPESLPTRSMNPKRATPC